MINMDIIDGNKTICREKYEELLDESKGQLLGYQKKTVEAICEHLENRKKVILADEVGLGKTFVAKGVIAQLAKKHWDNSEKDLRPFRVAYLCPNVNVALQNYPKLQLYETHLGIKGNEKLEEELKEAWEKYKNTDGLRWGDNQKEYVKKTDTACTRLYDWLMCIAKGQYADLQSKLEEVVNDWKVGEGIKHTSLNSIVENKADCLINDCIKAMAEDEPAKEIFEKYKRSSTSEQGKFREIGEIYKFNKKVAKYLSTGGVQEDYRLSMQHLYALEAENYSSKRVMQLECLTPRTSLKIGSGEGTAEERALIAATIMIGKNESSEEDFVEKFKGKVNEEKFQSYFKDYKNRLENVDNWDNIKDMIRTSLPDNLEEIDITACRKQFIEYNIDYFLQYDLVIMDEFQNFSELIGSKGDTESYRLAQKLFQREDCKILMLSATPFSINDYIPQDFREEPEEEQPYEGREDERSHDGKNEEEIFEDFFKLIDFMNSDINKFDINEWKDSWISARKRNDNKECENMLFKAGIFRTERNAATKHAIVAEGTKESILCSFKERLKINLLMNELEQEKNYRAEYGNSTPFPLVFSGGYKFQKSLEKKEIDNKYKTLFLTESQFEDNIPINTGHGRFEELKRELFKSAAVLEDKLSPASMLWIPLCNHGGQLKGAFKGREGYSKTLIFSHNKMTPKAFTYLLCHEAKCKIKQNSYAESLSDEDLEEKLEETLKKLISPTEQKEVYPKTKNSLLQYFANLFTSDVGISAVRSVYPKEEYEYLDAVVRYCNDGCFSAMIEEYIGLLNVEYSTDLRMSNIINQIRKFKLVKPALLVAEEKDKDADKFQIKKIGIEVANRYAMGLFSEKENADTTFRMKNIKVIFNSPFWPFVFTSTSIGTEGIDLHWYARNVIHWSVPSRPIDIEQREGRVLRYQCHAFRLNAALKPQKSDCVNELWFESGMFETQLNYSDSDEKCYHVTRNVFFEKNGKDIKKYDIAAKIVSTYRSALGREQILSEENEANALDLSPWSRTGGKRKIYITGDCHSDFKRFNRKLFPEQREMTKEDYVIICGDFGGVWDKDTESKEETHLLDWLDGKSFTTLFVDGNHENFDRLYGYPVEEWHGGKVHKIRPSVIHLMRGQVFEIEGKKIFTFGGASSHDIQGGILELDDPLYEQKKKRLDKSWHPYRINHLSWWAQELPSREEMEEGIKNLEANGNVVDFIVSHCCASSTQTLLGGSLFEPDVLTTYFEELLHKVQFKKWFFGHYHDNININAEEILLYEQIIRIS